MTEALCLFTDVTDPVIKMAEELVGFSGLLVVIYPRVDDPSREQVQFLG
jgi:hypothetical protein